MALPQNGTAIRLSFAQSVPSRSFCRPIIAYADPRSNRLLMETKMSVGKIAAVVASSIVLAGAQPAVASIVIGQLAAPDAAYTQALTSLNGTTHVAGDTRLFMTSRTGQISYYDRA